MMTHKSLLTVSSKNEHINYGNCKTESVEHSCSFITGALIERIHWITLKSWLFPKQIYFCANLLIEMTGKMNYSK